MTPERQRFIESSPVARLTRAELREGWHFCEDFDGLLTQGEQLDELGRCAFCGFDKRRVPPGRGADEVVKHRLLSVLVARLMLRSLQ